MALSDSENQNKTYTLQQAAEELSVSVDTLLRWNDFNILKPSITTSGEIAYSQKQLDAFMEIQQIMQPNIKEPEQVQPMNATPLVSPVMPVAHPAEVFFSSNIESSKRSPLAITLFFSVLIVAAILSTFIPHNSLTAQKDSASSDKALASQINKPNFSESTPLSMQEKGVEVANNRLDEPQVLASNTDKGNSPNVQTDVHAKLDNAGYSEIANTTNADKHSLFDASGNIKGENSSSDIVGMALGVTKMIQGDNSVKTGANSNILLMFVILVAVSVFFILKKQFAYNGDADLAVQPVNFSTSTGNQKVLEVDQKMDGTVVLNFQGKEYKLCKPELDSESDQFIERLMELSYPDRKEIDYDKSDDANLRISTPLSKLVTRLGFVGMKRNLFFPRTSKNKVLFRRYITEDDLLSMNLKTGQISKEFLQ